MLDFFTEWVLPIMGTLFLIMVFVVVTVMFFSLVSRGAMVCFI